MVLDLRGHDCRYSIEQSMLFLYPQEHPFYSHEKPTDGSPYAKVEAFYEKERISVKTDLEICGRIYQAVAEDDNSEDPWERERLLRHTVKRSFYQAACLHLGKHPVWGSLTGIKPSKLVRSMLQKGLSIQEVSDILMDKYDVSEEKTNLCLKTALISKDLADERTENDFSLYIGIPFCPSRCAYCSFVSHSIEKSTALMDPYLEALFRELAVTGRMVSQKGLKLKTVYVGGGTPSILSQSQMATLIGRIYSNFDMNQCEEFTVECGRPDTITREKLSTLIRGGVDRISINPQSMNDAVLRACGRKHTSRQIHTAYEWAQQAGFRNINMDLIAGLPEDNEESFYKSLDEVLSMKPANVTVHTLARKNGSDLETVEERLPSAAQVEKMIQYCSQRLRQENYEPYYLYRQKFMSGNFENVGWMLPGACCRYNVYMMEEIHTVISCGATAVSKVVDQKTGKVKRIKNPKYPIEYLKDLEKVLLEKENFSPAIK